jgi:nondiscriminating glutamyl-tRNA synthetase
MEKVRVRFAPSPTGPLHIGGARSALFNYLYAKQNNGDFVVRIEDTDRERSSKESEENIKASLRWLGIDWNEGIDVGGPHEPYRQMERLQTYQDAVNKLLETGYAYYCYCTEEEIEAEKEACRKAGKMPMYSGKCLHLTEEEIAAKKAAGIKPTIRFHVKDGDPIVIHDLVRGDVQFERDGIGDFVIVKSDGIPVYNFAVVVDDHLMEISHVLRGEEHLSNTPRQAVIYEALGWEMPTFGHISLILGKDRTKMSKRNGDVSCVAYQEHGYLPEALVNFLALLGWSPEGEEEMFTIEQMISLFSLDRVSKSPAVFDIDKLKWMNQQYIKKLSAEDLAELLKPYLESTGLAGERLLLFAETMSNHICTLEECKDYLPLIQGGIAEISDEALLDILHQETVPLVLKSFYEKLSTAEVFDAAAVKTALKQIRKENKLGGAQVFMPVRIALTGEQHGPDIDKLVALMGRETYEARLKQTANQLGIEL